MDNRPWGSTMAQSGFQERGEGPQSAGAPHQAIAQAPQPQLPPSATGLSELCPTAPTLEQGELSWWSA